MTIINDFSVLVFSSLELKDVLEGDNNYLNIYLGSDITLTSGIKINKNKTSVFINGTYDNITYNLTDRNTLNASDTIQITSATTNRVVVSNLNFVGNNYYGIIYVPEGTSYKDVIIEYKNITYKGPQMSFNPSGTTRLIDCDITINDVSIVVGNEVCECNKVEIGGTTTILHQSKSNSGFWFRGSEPSLTILSNAKVNYTSTSRELLYGTNDLIFNILTNATFNVVAYNGFGYGTNGTSITNILENATFILKKTNYSGGYATFYSYGGFKVDLNASLYIINDYLNMTSSNYNIYFSNKGSFTLNNPKRVVLYNLKTNIIYTPSSIPFNFTFNRLNLFTTSIDMNASILNNLPTFSWYKSDLSIITGTFTSTNTVINSNNYTEEELKEMPLSNFVFPNKRILSVGEFGFLVNNIATTTTLIEGTTLSLASILITYNDITEEIQADLNGNFSLDIPLLTIGTVITFNIKEHDDLIYHTKKVVVVYSGEIIIKNAPSLITFDLTPIELNPIICKKQGSIEIEVVDTRIDSTDWKLYATISHDLQSDDKSLTNSLIFKDNLGKINYLSKDPALIYEGVKSDGSMKQTIISFKPEEGILLLIQDRLINKIEYKTVINWYLEY